MESQITMLITLAATSGVLTFFLCLYAFIKRAEIPCARIFIIYTATLVIYIFAVAFEWSSESMEAIKRWAILEYVGIAMAPPLGLILVIEYLGKKVSSRAIVLSLIIPTITLVMVATNDYHHLFYKEMYFRPNVPFRTIDVVIGQWYVVHGAYTFGCMFAAFVLLLRSWRKTKSSYRKQLLTMICGQVLPMTAAFLYLMGLSPYGLDPVPLVLCITSGLYIWALINIRLFTIVPIAKEFIFESMREGVLVLDSSDRLVDLNGSALRMLPGLQSSMIGTSLDELWSDLTGVSFPVDRRLDGTQEELSWHTASAESIYQVRFSSVRGREGDHIGSLLMLIDITEERKLKEQLVHMAYYDGLTNLLYRNPFIQQSKELLVHHGQRQSPVSFILFDIDHFKRINDTYGHDTGDRAIQHVVATARSVLPSEALFARLGGEEFVLALPGLGLQEAASIAEDIRRSLAGSPLKSYQGSIPITSSFGVVEGRAIHDTLEALLRDADTAMYQAKQNGRNQVRLYSRDQDEPMVSMKLSR